MPKIAEIKEIDGEIWVRIGRVGEFASGIAIMSPEEISAKEREYSKAYDDGYADAQKYIEECNRERQPDALLELSERLRVAEECLEAIKDMAAGWQPARHTHEYIERHAQEALKRITAPMGKTEGE